MNRLMQKLNGKTVAIVGNGFVREDVSAEIDAADVVVRFNHFYNYDTNKVGKRVDVVMQTITPVWEKAPNKHLDVLDKYRPEVFLVRADYPYTTAIHKFYGNAIRVNDCTRWFEFEKRFTTGTTVLAFLARSLKNCKVRCYGFQDEADWQRYSTTDARAFNHPEERKTMLESIKILEALTITNPEERLDFLPQTIVIPVKATSIGCPNKNAALINRCIETALKTKLPITVVGDDYDLMHEVSAKYNIGTCALPTIPPHQDITDTLRDWRVKTGYCGDVCLVQCTSPFLKEEWITECFKHSIHSPICATATKIKFKPTAMYNFDSGVFIRTAANLPASSVARQLLPLTVRITGAVECFHTDALDHKSFFDDGVLFPIMVSEEESLDVDSYEDLILALKRIEEATAATAETQA